jgi:hypothetical protein
MGGSIMQKKLLKRIAKIVVQGKLIKIDRGSKVYQNGKHYYLVTSEGVEHKYPSGWISELHKANAFNNDIKVIHV